MDCTIAFKWWQLLLLYKHFVLLLHSVVNCGESGAAGELFHDTRSKGENRGCPTQ